MKYLPPLKAMQFFWVAARQQSFKLAAAQLHVTQAAVSQQIRLLEEHLQVRLFHRQGQQTRLTDAGKQLLPYVHTGFEALTQGVQALVKDPKPHVLRLSTLHSFTSLWLIPRLQEFQDLYPDIMVQLAPSNDLVDFSQSDIDLAIRLGIGGYQPLTEKKILREQLILVASPKLLQGVDIMDPKQVFALPWLEDTCMRKTFSHCCAHFGVDMQQLTPLISSDNAAPLITSAIEGQGFAVVNSGMVADHLRSGKLVPLLDYSRESDYHLFLVAPEAHFNWPKVKCFEDWFLPKVKASFGDLQQW